MLIYEDEWLIVCQKEPGILSQPKGDGKGQDMLSLLSDLFAARGEGTVPYPVHRLDRQTGGVMVFAKDARTAAILSKAAAGNDMRKTYLAVTEGQPNEPTGELHDLLFFDRGRDKTYVVDRMRRGVHEASLSYRRLGVREIEGRILSLLQIELHTGRTHQIRAQLASRHLPLYGDARYGAKTRGRLGLLAASLSFTHPRTGKALSFSVPLPKEIPFCFFD